MSDAQSLCAARAAAEKPVREALHRHIRRFDRNFRKDLHKLAKRSSRLEDLLYVFPGAAVSLAAGGHSAGAREHAARLIEKGRPLAEAAMALKTPLWLKRLPPEAFGAPPCGLPSDRGFVCQIANHFPALLEESGLWLSRLTFTLEACGPDFALWLAGQRVAAPAPGPKASDGVLPLLPLAAFAWLSSDGEHAARAGIASPWRGDMTFARAVEKAFTWFNRVLLNLSVPADEDVEEGASPWRRTLVCNGFAFTPLLTRLELAVEAQVMRNCLAGYGYAVESGQSLIYSVRSDGETAADLEVRFSGDGLPVISQLRGPRNASPPDGVAQAANAWLAGLSGIRPPLRAAVRTPQAPSSANWTGIKVNHERWEEIWRPYWRAHPRFEPLLCVTRLETQERLWADFSLLRQWAR